MLEVLKKTYSVFKNKLAEIRKSDEKRKKRWLLGVSGAAMAVVIILWVLYLKATMPKIESVAITNSTNTINEEVSFQKKESVFKTLERGFKEIKSDFQNKFTFFKNELSQNFNNLKNQLQKTNDFSLEKETGGGINSVQREQIPSTPLP